MTYSTPTLSRPCVCQKCGQAFTDGGRGRKTLTCPDCKIPKCRTCQTPVMLIWRGGPKAGFVSTGYYCSDDCKPRCSIEGCERPVRKRGWCANHYATWRDHGDPAAATKYKWLPERGACLACGTEDPALWQKQSRRFCSDKCQVMWYKHKGEIPEGFDCAVCGTFVPYFDPVTRKRLRSDAAFCAAHIRHARVYVTAEQIAAEDGTDCRLCGEPVDMSIPGPNRLAPTNDHITPRAHGGSDYRENLQLAHKGCNSSKRHFYAG